MRDLPKDAKTKLIRARVLKRCVCPTCKTIPGPKSLNRGIDGGFKESKESN
jgi:hypothetical protein